MKYIQSILILVFINLFSIIISEENISLSDVNVTNLENTINLTLDSLSNIIIDSSNDIDENNLWPDEYCVRLILYYNGTIDKKYELKNATNFTGKDYFSLATYDKIILYDFLQENNDPCSYRNTFNTINNFDECRTIGEQNRDRNHYCCYINGTDYIKETNKTSSYKSCIRVDKNEFDRFKSNPFYISNPDGNNESFGSLKCFDKIYFQGLYKSIIIFIIFFVF